jgi:hypothetical protein
MGGLLRNEPAMVFVELMQPMPKGGNANFKRGAYRDALRMAFRALSVPLIEVPPKEWQKDLGIKNGKNDDAKSQAYLIASRMFPSSDLVRVRGRILDGRSDALLIGGVWPTGCPSKEGRRGGLDAGFPLAGTRQERANRRGPQADRSEGGLESMAFPSGMSAQPPWPIHEKSNPGNGFSSGRRGTKKREMRSA